MIRRQSGSALLLLMVLLASALASIGMAALQRASAGDARRTHDLRTLAVAVDALRTAAFAQRCINTAMPLNDLLPCPDAAGTEGIAAVSCPGRAVGWLPWRTLGTAAIKDSSGTCLWYERQGTTARVIGAGSAVAGQDRTTTAVRPVCGGNLLAANYVDAGDVSLAVTLDTATMVARCP